MALLVFYSARLETWASQVRIVSRTESPSGWLALPTKYELGQGCSKTELRNCVQQITH